MITDKVLGIDIGGTTIKAGLLGRDGEVEGRESVETAGTSNESFAEALETILKKFIPAHKIAGIGIGSPGPMNAEEGIIISSANMPGVNNFRLLDKVRQIAADLGAGETPVKLDNDANCATLGAFFFGPGKEYSDMAVFTLGTGVGGGLVLNDSLFRGYQGNGFEAGHMPLLPADNEPATIPVFQCGCGAKGCLETVSSATGLKNYYRHFSGRDSEISAADIGILADRGDEAALKAFEIFGRGLGLGAASVIQLLNVPLIVFTGGVAASSRHFKKVLEETLYGRIFKVFKDRLELVYTEGDKSAGITGAGALIFEDELKKG